MLPFGVLNAPALLQELMKKSGLLDGYGACLWPSWVQ